MSCRDWLSTLWPASFRGISFYVEQDEEIPGRRIAIHEFPHRDTPFLEDMGEAARRFSVNAYLASDSADSQAKALAAAVARKGAGALVLPTHGVIKVRAITGARQRDKDRHGFIAFRIEFVREGASSALASVGLAASQAFAAVSALGSAAASAITLVAVAGQAERVAASAVSGLRDAASTLEAVRATSPVDSAVSAAAARALEGIYDDAPKLISRASGVDAAVSTRLFSAVSDLIGGLAPDIALPIVRALADYGRADAPSFATATARRVWLAEAEVARALRLAALGAYAETLLRSGFTDRPSGLTARAEMVERFGAEMVATAGGLDAELFVAIADLRGRTVEYLSASITDLAPVAQVEAPRMMPSLWWAWRLYGDPARADEIVARNRLPHPSFVPRLFEALVD